MKFCSSLLMLIVIFAFTFNAAADTVKLNVLEWEGYISPFENDFKKYAKEKGVDVELEFITPVISTPEDIFLRMRSQKADVVTPTNNYYHGEKSKLLKILYPIDYGRLSNYGKILKSLRDSDYDLYNGKKYSVPLLGGSYGLAYNADRVKTPPTSWNVLWEPAYKNKFAVTKDQYAANLYITQLVLGIKPELFYDIDKSNMNIPEVQSKLNVLVKNARSFWEGMADVDEMESLDLVTTYWFGVAAANKVGQNWKMANPVEGQTVWLDTMALGGHLKGQTKKIEAAHLLLDFMISEEIQAKIAEMYGSIIVNGDTAKLFSPEEVKNRRIGDAGFFKSEFLWRPLTTRTQNMYKKMWSTAVSAAGK